MSWICAAVFHLLRALFFFFWDGFKALLSPCGRRRSMVDYGDEICLITGAAQGLGKQLALEFAERNAVLVLWDIQEEKLKAVANDIKDMGNEVYHYVCDCSKREDIYRVAALVKKEVGSVSILVNNAGILNVRALLDADDEEIEETFKVNTLAHFWTVKAFLPWMLNNNYGHIVHISSVLAFGGFPKLTDYGASKAAVLSFSESLRLELRQQKKTGITVTCVCPYHIDTDQITGVTSNFPSLFVPLKVELVAQRILQALRDRQFLVVIPRSAYTQVFLKGIIPTRSTDCILDLVGANHALDAARTKGKKSQ